VETRDECVELLFDSLLDAPFGDETKRVSANLSAEANGHLLNIFLLVLVGDLNLLATRLQLNADSLAESLVVRRERELKRIGDVIVTAEELARVGT
jgi:hypothetical protein